MENKIVVTQIQQSLKMQRVHYELLSQAVGTWPLIFEKNSQRIQTCDHNVNSRTLARVLEFRDSPNYECLHTIAALFDDVDIIRQLPRFDDQWTVCEIPDSCSKSVAEFLFDRLDHDTQIVLGVLHGMIDLSKPMKTPLSVSTIKRILSLRDNDELRNWILLTGIVETPELPLHYELSTETVRWLLDQGVSPLHFNLRQLWRFDEFEQGGHSGESLQLFTDCGLDVVLELETRFPHWWSIGVLSKFIVDGNEAAVDILWREHFEDIAICSSLFDLNTTKWILARCDQQQFSRLLQQRWRCSDFEVAKYLYARGFVVELYAIEIGFQNEHRLFEEPYGIVRLFDNVSIAVLDELRTVGYTRFELCPSVYYEVPLIQWVAERSGLPRKINIETPTTQQQLEWIRSHYVLNLSTRDWTIKNGEL